MTTPFNADALIKKYTPLLVLYPEIPSQSARKMNPDYPHDSPLAHDYHPRDIRIVLEHSTLNGGFRLGQGSPVGWEEMLDKIEQGDYENDLDLLPGVDPNEKEKFWETYANIPKDQAKYERICYARVLSGVGMEKDRIVIQYWYPYFYNDFWNTHEMDWETVMIVLADTDGGPLPTICAYSAHMGGHWLRWQHIEKANDEEEPTEDGSHPVVYVANGSHANYFYGSGLYPTAPPLASMAADLVKKNKRLVDYTTSWEAGSRHLVEAKPIPADQNGVWTGEWRWLNQKALWGSAGKWLDLEFGDSGPKGPPQAGDRWDFPTVWIDSHCTRAPNRAEILVPSRIEP